MGIASSTEATIKLMAEQIEHLDTEGHLRAPSTTTAATALGNRSDHQRAAGQVAIGASVRHRSAEQ